MSETNMRPWQKFLRYLNDHKDTLFVFVLLAFAFGYFYHDPQWNGNSRLGLVMAVVHEHQLEIDTFHNSPYFRTGDKAFYNGHYYSDKAIGTALLGVLVYWPVQQVSQLLQVQLPVWNIKYLLTFLVIGVPSAVAGSVMFVMLRRICGDRWRAYVATMAVFLGTMCFPYSALFYGHQLAAAFLVGAFYLIFQLRSADTLHSGWRFFFIGLLLGMSLITEYPTILIVAALIAYFGTLLWRRVRNSTQSKSTLAWAFALALFGGAIPVVIWGVYNTLCFGAPLALGYQHEALEAFSEPMSKGILGVQLPTLRVLYYLTIHPAHGLFWLSPVLVMSLVGFALMMLTRRGQFSGYRAEALLGLFALVSFLLFNAGYFEWWGGDAFGPRHLIPALPLLAVPLAFIPRRAFWLVSLLCLVSVVQMTIVNAHNPQLSGHVKHRIDSMSFFEYSPIFSENLKGMLEGKFAVNLARLWPGLQEFWSLAPLLLVLAMATLYFYLPGVLSHFSRKEAAAT